MKISQKKVGCIAFVFLLLCGVATALAAEETKDTRAVAQVNGQAITSSDFDAAMVVAKQQYVDLGWQEGDTEGLQEIENLTLNRLIDFELLYQASQKEQIKVEESALAEQMAAFKNQFPSAAEFQDFLTANALTEEAMQRQLHHKMAIEGLQDNLLDQFTTASTITDEEIRLFYDDNKESIKQPEKVRTSHILVVVKATANNTARQAALAKIKTIQHKLKGGGDFALLAQESSDCPSKANGGDLDFFSREQMVKPFADVAFTTPVGQISDIVTTEFGYHLIKVTDKQAARQLPFAEVKEKINTYLNQQKIDGQFEGYLNDLRNQADIKKMLPAQNS